MIKPQILEKRAKTGFHSMKITLSQEVEQQKVPINVLLILMKVFIFVFLKKIFQIY